MTLQTSLVREHGMCYSLDGSVNAVMDTLLYILYRTTWPGVKLQQALQKVDLACAVH